MRTRRRKAEYLQDLDGATTTLSAWQVKGVRRMQSAANVLADPRPDLAEDSWLWARLLPWAYGADGAEPESLFGAVHGLRCGGARLRLEKGLCRLTRGEWPASEYAQLRDRYVMPHAMRLNKLLLDLGLWGAVQIAQKTEQEVML